MILLLNLKSFFTSNKILAVAFCVLTLTCITGGLFGANYFFCNITYYNEYLTTQKLYTLTNLGQNATLSVQEYLNEYKDITEHAVAIFNAEITCEEIESGENQESENQQGVSQTKPKPTSYKIEAIIYLSENYKTATYSAYGEQLSVEHISEGANKIVLSQMLFGTEYIGKTVTLCGKNYQVIGLSPSQNFIPFFSLTDTTAIKNFTITLKKPFKTATLKEQFASSLTNCFKGFVINAPKNEDLKHIFNYLPMLTPTLLLVFLGFVNLNFLYSYFIKMRKKNYAVMRLSGASSNKILTLFAGETLTIFSVAFAVSLALFKVITALFFNTPPTFENAYLIGATVFDALNILNIIAIYLVMALFLFVSFAPSFIKAVRRDIRV